MKVVLLGVLALCTCSCGSAPTTSPQSTAAESPPKINQDPAIRAAELAVRVANNTATPEEKLELETFLKGKK